MTAWTRTAAEVQAALLALRTGRYRNMRELQCTFLSTAEFVGSILPPGLEPADRPSGSVRVAAFDSDHLGSYLAASVQFDARHDDLEGRYVLAMYMTTFPAIVFGRELFGEPKKDAEIVLSASREHRVEGVVRRHGVELVRLSGELGSDSGPERRVARTFNYRTSMKVDGSGLDSDPVLTVGTFEAELSSLRHGIPRLVLSGTIHDPLNQVPVVELVDCTYVEGELSASATAVGAVPRDDFLPYLFNRYDDWRIGRSAEPETVNP